MPQTNGAPFPADAAQPWTVHTIVKTLLMQWLVLPVVVQLGGLVIIMPAAALKIEDPALSILLAFFLFLPAIGSGWLYGCRPRLSPKWTVRYLPTAFYPACLLATWIAVMAIGGGDFTDDHFRYVSYLILPYFFVFISAAFSGEYWYTLLVPLAANVFFITAFIVTAQRRNPIAIPCRPATGIALIFLTLLSVCGWQALERQKDLLPPAAMEKPELSEEVNLRQYQPFGENAASLATLRETPTLRLDTDLPRLDGALAFYPVYAAAVQALYTTPATTGADINTLVRGSPSPDAYRRLFDGEADLIFSAAPSEAQKQAARDKGLELTLTPVASEAFVFLVSRDNPVESLSVEQIRAIYRGNVSNWRLVGGRDAAILAFQRPEGSGSQSTMASKVMQGAPMRKPLEGEFARGMGGLVRRIAEYRNDSAAIGYSFRYYVTRMKETDDVRLLPVDGIAPTLQTIRDGSYPFIVNVYMVTARPPSANTRKLMDWFLSPQGQQLIEDAGYVSLGEIRH